MVTGRFRRRILSVVREIASLLASDAIPYVRCRTEEASAVFAYCGRIAYVAGAPRQIVVCYLVLRLKKGAPPWEFVPGAIARAALGGSLRCTQQLQDGSIARRWSVCAVAREWMCRPIAFGRRWYFLGVSLVPTGTAVIVLGAKVQ